MHGLTPPRRDFYKLHVRKLRGMKQYYPVHLEEYSLSRKISDAPYFE